MDDVLRYAPLLAVVGLLGAGFQLNRIEKQNERVQTLLRELLDRRL